MDMQDKSKMLDKISNGCFFVLIFGYMILSMLKVPYQIINGISAITASILYITILVRYKISHDKMHHGLLVLGIICIIGQFISLGITSKYLGILSTVFVYIFYIYNQKLSYGIWNKFLIFFGIYVVSSSVLSMYVDKKIVTVLFVIMEFVIYGKLLNQMMYKIGMKRKEKLDKEGFTKTDAEKIPLIRRILFGRTGKLDFSIIEMITGKNFTKKNNLNNE